MGKWMITWKRRNPSGIGGEFPGTVIEAESEYHAIEWARDNTPPSMVFPDVEPEIAVEPYKPWWEDLHDLVERAKQQSEDS